MILPGKHIPVHRSLSGIGANILRELDAPQSVSETWARVRDYNGKKTGPITFDWFVLTISWLFAISAVEYKDGLLVRAIKP